MFMKLKKTTNRHLCDLNTYRSLPNKWLVLQAINILERWFGVLAQNGSMYWLMLYIACYKLLLTWHKEQKSHFSSFSSSLCLTPMDCVVLQSTYLPHALKQCVYDWENATSHEAVTQAVLRLSSHFVTSGKHNISPLFQELGWKDPVSR